MKQTTFFFYALSVYVILQFSWWGYHLIELTKATDTNASIVDKRIMMVIGEGAVFFLMLLIGLWKIRSSIRKEFELSQRQNNFLLSVTHELKTPIAANKLYLQTIQKRNPDEEMRSDLLNKALKENQRLEHLIDNILNAARVENRALQPIKESVDLNHFINALVVQFRKRYPTATIEVLHAPHKTVHFDVFMIETVLSNLIDNAVKYSQDKAHININASLTDTQVLLTVSDFGIGIKQEDQAAIFSKFYRIGNEETRTQKGSGLGLFIAQEFLRLHGGSIQYQQNTPKGSIFKLNIPV
ncbi:MAG: HAMP domain-containing histidine kinase [Crocinitomicaceae bacterium]|nr:HAMP domain-containing histidine kinase [Crocinitomicaceae bacterium]MCF8409915.1 HAMP domain-containing histidine kinase [Crocinitomicaceae bacterium]MCF8443780.1 HAMP domain-containing histidine kinase [Crocinitomicaceae bacterium]